MDKQIVQQLESGENIDDVVKERAMALHAHIPKLWQGVQFDEATHNRFAEQYGETPEASSTTMPFLTNGLLYMARMGKDLYQGMDSVLARVTEKATKQGVRMRFSLGLLEKDKVVTLADVNPAEQGFQDKELTTIFEGWKFIEMMGHTGDFYNENSEVLPGIFRSMAKENPPSHK